MQVGPQAIVLDTSVVLEALLAGPEALRRVCCIPRSNGGAQLRVRFTQLLELELAEAAFRLALRERHGNRWQRARMTEEPGRERVAGCNRFSPHGVTFYPELPMLRSQLRRSPAAFRG
jgi:hypothetical protein